MQASNWPHRAARLTSPHRAACKRAAPGSISGLFVSPPIQLHRPCRHPDRLLAAHDSTYSPDATQHPRYQEGKKPLAPKSKNMKNPPSRKGKAPATKLSRHQSAGKENRPSQIQKPIAQKVTPPANAAVSLLEEDRAGKCLQFIHFAC